MTFMISFMKLLKSGLVIGFIRIVNHIINLLVRVRIKWTLYLCISDQELRIEFKL